MRDIRFRVWNGEYMVSEEYDCYISDGGGVFIDAEHKHNTPHTEIQSAKTLEIMQYTGLHDRNGTEIYEGDMLSTDLDRPYNIVVYRNGAFMLECEDGGETYYDFITYVSTQTIDRIGSEVIGNIYENPELMKGGEK